MIVIETTPRHVERESNHKDYYTHQVFGESIANKHGLSEIHKLNIKLSKDLGGLSND